MPCPSQTSGFNVPNYVRAVTLREEGYTIKEIARKLGNGATLSGVQKTDFGMDSARKRKEGKTKENLDERYKKWNEGERFGRTGLGGKRRMEEEDKNLNILDTGRCSLYCNPVNK
ncbi:hypothetical protein ANN_16438 [Periplaneta americana]|uniref:Uncharacterized protein n=1 Tax=Periplaneta americana TaxID=6978 RepID=A0ABQ8SJ99_PERAM|nr:hypothetical protein ANN_16438 [Periplaneta americana]